MHELHSNECEQEVVCCFTFLSLLREKIALVYFIVVKGEREGERKMNINIVKCEMSYSACSTRRHIHVQTSRNEEEATSKDDLTRQRQTQFRAPAKNLQIHFFSLLLMPGDVFAVVVVKLQRCTIKNCFHFQLLHFTFHQHHSTIFCIFIARCCTSPRSFFMIFIVKN